MKNFTQSPAIGTRVQWIGPGRCAKCGGHNYKSGTVAEIVNDLYVMVRRDDSGATEKFFAGGLSATQKKRTKLTESQARLVHGVAWALLVGEDYAYIETGRYKPFSIATVNSAIERDLVAFHPTERPRAYRNDVHYVVPVGRVAELIAELAEWQYGELMAYFDDNGIEYNPDTDLYNSRHLAFVNRLGM